MAAVPEGQILTGLNFELGTYIQIGGEVVAKEYPDTIINRSHIIRNIDGSETGTAGECI